MTDMIPDLLRGAQKNISPTPTTNSANFNVKKVIGRTPSFGQITYLTQKIFFLLGY